MAKMTVQILDYQSDIKKGGTDGANTGLYKNLRHKIRQGYQDCYDTVGSGKGCSCPVTGLFIPRYLEATFSEDPTGKALSKDCAKIKVVVAKPDVATIKAAVDKLKNCGAICIDYVGERWVNVPPALGNYTPTTTLIPLNEGVRAIYVSGIQPKYESDGVSGDQAVRVRYEATPTELTGATLPADADKKATAGGKFLACHGALDEAALCGAAASISPRRIILKGNGAVAGQIIGGLPPSKVIRECVVYKENLILSCLSDLGNIAGVQCLGYQGEVVKNAHILIA